MCEIMQPLVKWPWEIIFQNISVLATLYVAVRLPHWQDQRKQASDLVAFRNIAHFAVNLMKQIEKEFSYQDPIFRRFNRGLEACHRLMQQQIHLDRVHQSNVMQAFAQLDVAVGEFRDHMQDGAGASDLHFAVEEAKKAMDIVDRYLDQRRFIKRQDLYTTEKRPFIRLWR